MIAVSSAKWFLVCYVWDVYRQIELLKASAMTVFSTVRKIDSIKKRMRKLTGMEKGWAKWMTNVRNEWGKILVTVLTDSESTRSLQPMANGLVKRFGIRQRENSSPSLGQSLYQRLPLLVYHIASSVRVGAFRAGLGSFFINWWCILRDVDNSQKPGKLPGCERDFSSCKALLITSKRF